MPTYNPTVVYGAPVAVYPGYSTGAMVATSLISFGVGIAVGAAISGGGGCCGWGWNSWGCGWHNNTVVYNHNTYISNSNTFVNRNNYYGHNNVNYKSTTTIATTLTSTITTGITLTRTITTGITSTPTTSIAITSTTTTIAPTTSTTATTLLRSSIRNTISLSIANSANTNLAQNNRQQPNFNQQNRQQPNFNQQNRAARSNPGQSRSNNYSQAQRSPERGYGQQPARGTNTGAFSNYGQGGNTQTNSARGQQSLEGNRGGGNAGAQSEAPRAADSVDRASADQPCQAGFRVQSQGEDVHADRARSPGVTWFPLDSAIASFVYSFRQRF